MWVGREERDFTTIQMFGTPLIQLFKKFVETYTGRGGI